MKNLSKVFLLFMLILFGFSSMSFAQNRDKEIDALLKKYGGKDLSSKSDKFAPDFKLQDIRQEIITLSDYREGRSVLLFFWTTWCPFCQKELRVLNSMYAELKKNEVGLLTINVGESTDDVTAFVRDYNLAFMVLLDRDTQVANNYDIIGVPTYVLIDKKGDIIYKDNSFPEAEFKLLTAK